MSSPRTSSGYSAADNASAHVSSSQHPLNITVMRLNKPTLHINRPLASPLLRNMHTVDGAHAVTNLLSLPDTPGDTYLGQVFSAYVRATNMHDTPVKNVKVTVEMHTPTARVSLKDKRATGTGQSQQGQGPPPRNQKLSLGKDGWRQWKSKAVNAASLGRKENSTSSG